jgi:hypothetical protein
MSREFTIPEPETPERSATGGLPADFFNGARIVENEAREIVPRDGPTPPRRSRGAPPAPGSSRPWSIVPVVAIVLLGNLILFLGGALAGWAFAKKEPPTPVNPAPSTIHPIVSEVARSVDSKASKDEVGGLRSVVSGLESEVKGLKAELAALARESAQIKERQSAPPKLVSPLIAPPAPSPDLKPLHARIDQLAEASKRLASVPADLSTLGKRFGELDSRLDSLRTEVGDLPRKIKEAVAPPPETAAAKPEKPPAKAADEARSRGAALFKEGKFLEARDLLLKQTEESPDDARLWYYAALANGFGTSDWRGETVRLVMRGMDRERAGTPSRAEIDASFSDLNQPQGKEWLRSWRERIGPR